MVRFILGVGVMLAISILDIRFWLVQAYIIYGGTWILLISVETLGFVGMGAKRWIDLYVFPFSPRN